MSIQDRSAPDRAAGHLAAGLLVDADIVLIPSPPESLWDAAADIEVLIFPARPGEHDRIDQLTGWKWSRFTLAGAPTAAITLKLSHHSTYAAQLGEVTSENLAAALDAGDGLWEALLRLDAIPADARDIDPDLLARVTAIEQVQREPRRADHTFESHRQMTDGFCIFFCFCHPHHPK
ncbi:hypothetical protein F4553_006110 [Allocatelliglobosispora scoriae]|uniref:Uncharacterized protein n=1 Tax=Allocatelliglobosispora scoriae TaxID=643052 RepID=A0A841BYN6_9ACTN|nr:hypothetical protein [Allocatelliglobosispora scoriae]MBB5872676.1 hypothetical protein [Allocatelliglobosispora scoriae]